MGISAAVALMFKAAGAGGEPPHEVERCISYETFREIATHVSADIPNMVGRTDLIIQVYSYILEKSQIIQNLSVLMKECHLNPGVSDYQLKGLAPCLHLS